MVWPAARGQFVNAGGHHLPTHDRVQMDALLNTYATGSQAGVWQTATGTDLVGANSRKIIVRDDPDGVYVGGVLVSSEADLRDFAAVLLSMAGARADRAGS